MPTWTDSSGRLLLKFKRTDFEAMPPSGAADAYIDALYGKTRILRQLFAMSPNQVRAMLGEYGAWDEIEMADHVANLKRLLWMACGDMREEGKI